jgi:hypothetical protein
MMTPEQFTQQSVAAVADLGLFLVGKPDRETKHLLLRMRDSLEANLEVSFGEEAAAKFAEEFIKAVVGHRNDIGADMVSRTLH